MATFLTRISTLPQDLHYHILLNCEIHPTMDYTYRNTLYASFPEPHQLINMAIYTHRKYQNPHFCPKVVLSRP